jgi:salicylate hydroxylase
MQRKLRVGIVGGGIGGLALANALVQFGMETKVFERARAFTEVGAGIQMTPNAVRVLNALNLGEKLGAQSFLPHSLVGRNWKTARVMWRTPLIDECPKRYGAPFYHVHRADLQQILLEPLPAKASALGMQCLGVEQSANSAVATFADGSQYEADVIVGADGIHSTLRATISDGLPPRFTGHMCWRSVVPFARQPLDFVSPDSSFWLGPNGHVVTYYICRGEAVNIVAVQETAQWVEESWNVESSQQELLDAYRGWHPNLLRLFSEAESVFKWGLFDRDPMTTWSRGRVTLLGDAAHPMLPYLSQGAAMAIEDAYVLAKSLAAGAAVAEALKEYEALRLPRTSRVQLESRERGRTYHLSSPVALFYRDLAYRMRGLFNPQSSGIGADWVYAFDATA